MLATVSGVLSILGHAETHLNKQPMHMSALTGKNLLNELLIGAMLQVFIITHGMIQFHGTIFIQMFSSILKTIFLVFAALFHYNIYYWMLLQEK